MSLAPPASLEPSATPPAASRDPRAFHLRRYFSVASGIAVLLATLGLAWAFHAHEVAEEIEDAEGRNVIMARTFANVIWPRFGARLAARGEGQPLPDDPVVARLHETFRTMSRDVAVVKIKVYSLDGRAVYSSVPAEIGQDASANRGFLAAREGRTASDFAYRDSISSTEGTIEHVHVVSTYIPIRANGGPVEAVFELYSDVTEGVSGITAATFKLIAGLVGAFAVLYAALLLIVVHADRVLRRQYRQLEENEAQIQAQNRELEAANRAKSEFLSSTSHELRTPMNAILGFAELLQSEPGAKLNANQSRFVHEILKAGRHLLELIDEVLDLARIEAGKMTLSVEPVEPRSVIEECLPLVQNMAREKAIALELPADWPQSAVMADYMRLKQALLNLLSNAIKYNRPGGTVALGVQPGSDARVRITVRDTGPGIPKSQHARLFQPFHRLAATTGDVEGTGIGLALTRNIVEAMGGAIGFESEWGAGSTFWIELPRAAAAPAPAPAGEPGAASPAADAPSAQRLLLYIEDNPANVLLMEQIARRLAMRFLSAHNAEIGVALAASARPDLVIMDINLPGMDGYEALELLKRDRATAAIPVMALSASAMGRDVSRGLAAGFVRYQTKPFHVDDMVRAITETIEARP